MAKARTGAVLLAGCLLWWAGAAPAGAAPTVAQMLAIRPKQEGVTCSTPTATEQDACKVELIKGTSPGSNGWLLRDPRGQPLRRFFDTNGDRQIDVLSFYLDGVEVYREMDSRLSGRVDQYRWLNAGGTRWGMHSGQDDGHRIDAWKMISAEEAGQEAFQAVLMRDLARLQALWINEEEMKSLGLPATEITRLQGIQRQAAAKFQATCAKLAGVADKAHWVRLEAGIPQCLPAEAQGAKQDIIRQPKAAVLYEAAGKHDWLALGEMIQVGSAWRLVDAPSPGDGTTDTQAAIAAADPELQRLLDELKALDAHAPHGENAGAEFVRYNLTRADLVSRMAAKAKPEERDQWVRQAADCLSSAAQASGDSDKSAYERLVQLEQQVVREQPGSPLAAFVTFREMTAENAARMAKATGSEMAKLQEQWLARLSKFITDYPQSEDTPDALHQLGMGNEFVGNEIAAKNWYEKLATGYPNHPLAAKAHGALRRLDLEGKPMELSGKAANGTPFELAQLHGKTVVVYYWASWNQQSVGDFARLKVLLNNYAAKGLELVCVNLDTAPPEASASQEPPPGLQIHQPGGLDSPLAVQYGVMVLPQMFLVGKDGKVLSRTVQIGTVEDEIKKQLK